MASVNQRIPRPPSVNNEGTRVRTLTPIQQLRRTALTTLLWENSYYESGIAIADRMKDLIAKVTPEEVAALAMEARDQMKLRHTPLYLVRCMAALPTHRHLVRATLREVIQRPDELAEFLAIYWKDGKCPIAKQVQRGLADAFNKFDEFTIAKYNRDSAIKLKDVAFLAHVNPTKAPVIPASKTLRPQILGRATTLEAIAGKGTGSKKYVRGEVKRHAKSTLGKLIAGELMTPDTWEVAISAAKGREEKEQEWSRLLDQNKLGAMALLRNLRNMQEAGISTARIGRAIDGSNVERVLPFRFIAAARYAPTLEPQLEKAMIRCVAGIEKLPGKTALVIDTSPSMWDHKVSGKSDMTRFEAAAALAILVREVCDEVAVYAFNERAYVVPTRRGFALRDALAATKGGASCGGLAVEMANAAGYDRIIVLTDGEWHYMANGGQFQHHGFSTGDALKVSPAPLTEKAYMVNVANTKNGVGYGKWTSIDGWSEAIVSYVSALESFG
jgi:hypothetical protein